MIRLFFTILRVLRLFLCVWFSAILCLTSFTPPERTAPTLFNHDTGNYFLPDYGQTLVAAHRTGKSKAPENTRMAVENGLESDDPPDIFETDLQITADGEVVLFHDLYLDDKTNAAELFGRKHVTVFSETYDALRELNMGETFEVNGETPYAGLRGNDIPEGLRIFRMEDFLDCVETAAPGRFHYVMEVKYPFVWARKIVDKIYTALSERDMTDRVIVASYWNDVTHYIDTHYKGKLMRSADPFEIMDFYGCFKCGTDLSREEIPFMALQLPYYWRNDKTLLVANFGQTAFIDYAHRYGISVQYWTVSKSEDVRSLTSGGADVIMTNHPERARADIRSAELYEQPTGS